MKVSSSVKRPFDQAINIALARLNEIDKVNNRKHDIIIETKILTPDEDDIKNNGWTKEDVKKNTKYLVNIEYILTSGNEVLIIYSKTTELNNKFEFENDFTWIPELYTGLIVDCLSAYALVARVHKEQQDKNKELAAV
jgi:hypothetical protein